MGEHGGGRLRNTMTLVPKTLTFFAIWIVLTGEYTFFRLGLGLVVSLAVAWVNTGEPISPVQRLPWLRILLYLPWLFLRILQSGLHLAAVILHPSLPIAPKLIHYRTELQDEAAVVLLGNSITLTPGTITAEVNSHGLIIHAIDEASAHDGTLRRLEQRIGQVFQRPRSTE